MSDDTEQPREHKFAVNSDDFIRFLFKKTGHRDCPACGGEQWTILANAELDLPYRISTPIKVGDRGASVNTYAVFCNDCGFLRQHLARNVRRWVDENPEPQQEMDFEGDDDDRDE